MLLSVGMRSLCGIHLQGVLMPSHVLGIYFYASFHIPENEKASILQLKFLQTLIKTFYCVAGQNSTGANRNRWQAKKTINQRYNICRFRHDPMIHKT